ncbi:DEP domain-containing protein 7 isoform X1 [Seriola lalandi dorsalis]|uniref:DEP domain-containing protein 7 n=1 Tax=Seriola lalandi dorsalis TaxID=1841481 RepID=A0A3B4YYI5_SERLL|nr:DEP domain-containing protein 7 isoform X1 [Seriola lalandi dorsalis]XP_056230837.1 DEP domain-containing protein 7 isoform X2 [Seriola aureovittata]
MHRTPGQGMAGKPFRATYIWSSIISNLHTHVEVKRRRHNLKSYHDCFLGAEAVDVVLAHITLNRFFGDEAVPRYKAVRLCQALMDSRVFEPVGIKVFGKEKKRATFEDSSCSLYRFLSPATSSSSSLTNANSHSTSTIESGYDSPSMNRNKNSYSPSRESQEVLGYSTHSPVTTDKTMEDVLGNLNLGSTITPQMINLGLSQERVDEVWHQQAVFRLLQLIELPLLENLLEGKDASRAPLHGTDSDPDLLYTSSYLDREVLKAFSEAQADEWMSGAVDCLEFLPDELVVEVSRGLAACANDVVQCKRLLYEVLAQHYGHTQQAPLLSNHVFDIHSGISELLVNGKQEQALEALQLSLKLQDSRSREELRRLLRFMATAAKPQEVKLHKEIENRMAVKRSFSSAIVYSRRLSKGKVDLMVLFMMDNHCDLFKIPVSLHKMVSDRIVNIVKGKDPDMITGSTYCTRLSAKAYSENAQKTTKEELWSLLRTVHEDPKLCAREKRRLLGQFYKGHPEIFVQYFGNRLSSINMLLQ